VHNFALPNPPQNPLTKPFTMLCNQSEQPETNEAQRLPLTRPTKRPRIHEKSADAYAA
jgi:hypothetical protein